MLFDLGPCLNPDEAHSFQFFQVPFIGTVEDSKNACQKKFSVVYHNCKAFDTLLG